MAENRVTNRTRKRTTLIFGTGDALNRRAFTEDISPTGLFIKTANVCTPDTMLTVELLDQGAPIRFEARVMWAKRVPQNLFHLVKKSGMGVRIVRFLCGRELYLTLAGATDTPEEEP